MTTFDIIEEGYSIRNAVVTRVSLFLKNDTLCYQLEISGSDFSGTIALNGLGSIKQKNADDSSRPTTVYVSSGVGSVAIMHIMNICGVSSWESIVGSNIRVAIKDDRIDLFGHIINEDMWFNQDYLMEQATDNKEFV